MKKVLYIGSTAYQSGRLDGVTVKSRVLYEMLREEKSVITRHLDVDSWSKRALILIPQILKELFWCDIIIISSAERGANLLLKFFRNINIQKPTYYFVAGGRLAESISSGKYNKNTYQNITKIYVESNIMVQQLKELGINNVEKMFNFRRKPNYQLSSEKKVVNEKNIKFVFYSRVIKEKGIEECIAAFNYLSSDLSNISLDIYGQVDENYLEEIRECFSENITYRGVIFPNNQLEYETLSKYDVFILPTFYPGECLPGALIDAYISGLAVIVSEWKYAHEYVSNNENGLIHKYKNQDDLILKMKLLIDNPDIIMKFKENSIRLSSQFYAENALKNFLKEISKVKGTS